VIQSQIFFKLMTFASIPLEPVRMISEECNIISNSFLVLFCFLFQVSVFNLRKF